MHTRSAGGICSEVLQGRDKLIAASIQWTEKIMAKIGREVFTYNGKVSPGPAELSLPIGLLAVCKALHLDKGFGVK
jgi:hypothetical protein